MPDTWDAVARVCGMLMARRAAARRLQADALTTNVGQQFAQAVLMYPIPDPELSFATVANEWAREMPQHRDEREVRAHLLRAIWARRLVVRKPTSGEPMLARELLYVVFKAKPHPGFEISATGVTQSSSSEEQPDGSLVVSFHGHIMLPDDQSHWTEQQVHDAIDVLGVQGFEAFAEQFRVGVSCLSVRRNDFAVYCRSVGYPLPSFWFGKHTVKLSTAKAESDCADWLRSLARKPKEQPKSSAISSKKCA